MEAVCLPGVSGCQVYALAAALHSLNLYCSAVSSAIICCSAPTIRYNIRWRGQNIRGVVCCCILLVWLCGAAAASLRPRVTVQLVAAAVMPLAWAASATLHVVLWTRRSSAPLLYFVVYWLLSAVSSAAIIWQLVRDGASSNVIELYIHIASMILALLMFGVDATCFYDEVTKRFETDQISSEVLNNINYKHNDTHFFYKITFFWLNSMLYKGYKSQLEDTDLGKLPEQELPEKYYNKFKKIFETQKIKKGKKLNILQCYLRMVWPNFYIAGIMKLLGDLISVVPPLGLAIIIQFIEGPHETFDINSRVTMHEFINNGYVMLLIVTLGLISQALLSQNSTHLVTVEGTRMKIALQGMVYDKCMRLAPWASRQAESINDESPLLHAIDEHTSKSGLLTNIVSQDTYNIMSCVWVCHYMWAVPLKVVVILYLLYTKLGISSIIGSAASILIITPLQFYIGKKISDNSKQISKCTDHRVSKMAEILQGINVIKLYVWEDLFNEKILNLREVELKLLNKDSTYWSFLTFTTQVSTLLVTVVTFTVFYFIEDERDLVATNVFAGLALFNQLSVPLLILPVTVMMVIQAMVSTKRIKDYLELPEFNDSIYEDSNEVIEENENVEDCIQSETKNYSKDDLSNDLQEDKESDDQFFDEISPLVDDKQEYMVRFKNAAFSWGNTNNTIIEIDDLEIPTGKLIMIVGSTGSGKTSLLSAILGEMHLERGEVHWNGAHSTWFAGQPPWLLEDTVRENIVMDSFWCQRKYSRVLRATALQPDLQLLPDGDATHLGSHGTPLSGGQRVRVSVARALYSNAQLLALDEPLGALDATLARHIVARGLLPTTRDGRTILVATNRLELLHYADLVITMEDGRISGYGCLSREGGGEGALSQWSRLAEEARAAAARGPTGPPGGSARERSRLLRAFSRHKAHTCTSDDSMEGRTLFLMAHMNHVQAYLWLQLGINEATGAHFLTEVSTCAGGSWRRRFTRARPTLERQHSSPPCSIHSTKLQHQVRRAASVDASNTNLKREASLLRRLLRRPRRGRATLSRWKPRTLRRFISSESETQIEDGQCSDDVLRWLAEKSEEPAMNTTKVSMSSNGTDHNVAIVDQKYLSHKEHSERISDFAVWWEYAKACGWWGVAFWLAAAGAQALAVAADCWLMLVTAGAKQTLTAEQKWYSVCVYGAWCVCGAALSGAAQAGSAAGGAAARRRLHERLLHTALHAPLHHHHATPLGATLYRFSSDILVIDKKLPTGVSRWAQLALLCGAAVLVNAAVAPWTFLALLPALLLYLSLQSIYLCNARELQREEARTAAGVVSLAAETSAGAGTVRAGRLQMRMRRAVMRRLAENHNVLLLLNSANRWLGLTLDLVGAGSVCVSLGVCMCSSEGGGGAGAGAAGLAGAYALLLPAYLSHLAKLRADLDLQLAAVERVRADTALPQEQYRDHLPVPRNWQRNGKIEFEDANIQPEPGMHTILKNINISISPGEKVAICGRSGSGKTSLLLSCVGATTIQSGRILVDGQECRGVPLRALRHRVVVLPQETTLFSGTLRENLDPLAVHTDHEIWDSLRTAGLQEFVSAQPAGLECSVTGGSGSGVWGGGRGARACAARAALHALPGGDDHAEHTPRASALLLDEPAAALDASAERVLLAALAAAAPNTTILTVAPSMGWTTSVSTESHLFRLCYRVVQHATACGHALSHSTHNKAIERISMLQHGHRISSVVGYDRAVVVEEGRVVEQGRVEALLARPASRLSRMLAAAHTHL